MNRVQSIQILRAVAALSVVMAHCAAYWHDAGHACSSSFQIGTYGVDLFFVISGYIIFRTATTAASPAEFLRRRFVRVAPVYYIQTAPHVLMALAAGTLTLPALATSFLFWPIWGPESTTPVLTVGWTLSFEMLFYTCFAGAMRLGGRGPAVFLGAYAAAAALNLAGSGGVFLFIGSPLLAEFLLGALIASVAWPMWPARGAGVVLLACAALAMRAMRGLGDTIAGSLAFHPDVALMRLFCAGLPCALLVLGAPQLEPWCRGRAAAVLSYLGDASYSIYLTHLLVIMGVGAAWRVMGAPAIGIPFAEFLCGVGAGVLAFELVEKPLLAFLRRLMDRRLDTTPRKPLEINGGFSGG